MKESHYQWIFPDETKETFQLWQKESPYSSIMTKLLYNRKIDTKEEAEQFLNPQLENLHDPFLLYDMEKAVQRILKAIENNERILIYGDYDCDGITSTTVLKEALEMIGGEVEFYLPNRFTDGYGPNKEIYQYFINDGVQLIITVDNGISGFDALSYAKEQGIDVIVIDHHQIQDHLPEAYAIIHPQHPHGNYPFKELAGVGVAFKLATALLGYIPTELLDVVAIGTIADVVSLTGENRILVSYGLSFLRETPRQGLLYLAQKQALRLEEIDSESVAFNIAPSLNALGRMDDANIGVTFLTTFDDEEAQNCAEIIFNQNNERKELVQQMMDEAVALVDPNQKIQIIAKEGWHEGVLGIIAGRLSEKLHQPCIVLSINKETGIAKGSGRSIAAINLMRIVEKENELLTTFGGHPVAIGLSIEIEKLPLFIEKMQMMMEEITIKKDELLVDTTLPISDINEDLLLEIKKLEPFGQDNMKPIFAIQPKKIKQIKKLGSKKTTIKAQIADDSGHLLSIICFNYDAFEREWLSSNDITFVGQLSVNEWNGQKTQQLQIKDYKITGIQLFDGRMQRVMEEEFMQQELCFVYFNPYHKARLEKLFPGHVMHDYAETKNIQCAIVLCDIPNSLDQMKQVINQNQTSQYIIVCRTFEDAYLNGMPTHQDFVKLFNFIAHNPQVNVVKDLKAIADFVKIPMQNLIFMIHLFKDLGFVTITNGIMEQNEVKEKKALTSSPLYKERESLIKNEEFLLYSDLSQLISWFQKQEEEK